MSVKLCKCGCGEEVGKQDFIFGHKDIWRRNWNQPCSCGCGEITQPGCTFIANHQARVVTAEEYKARGEKTSRTKQANPLSEEARRLNSERNIGEKNPMWGKTRSEETRKKAGESIKKKWADPEHHAKQAAAIRAVTSNPEWQANVRRRSGESHPGYKGGVSKLNRGSGWGPGAKRRVKIRDNYTCIGCNKKESELDYPLNIHHIDYDRYNHKLSNLVSLCRNCHARVNGDKENCKLFFLQYIEDLYNDTIIKEADENFDPIQAKKDALRARFQDPVVKEKLIRSKLRGENHSHWNGGTSNGSLGISRQQFMKWQGKIFDRDGYTCQICSKTKDDGIVLCMHHINYIKTDFRDDNLITLCVACNNKSTWDRETYKETLTQKVNEILSTKSLPVGVGLSSKEATKIVLERDNNTCKICGRSEDMVLRVHSIDDTLDFVEDNLITLCSTCNTNKMYRRKEFWKKTLSDIVKGVISPTVNELYALEQGSPVEVEKKAFGIGDTKRKQWRDKIFARDNNSCVVCKTTDKQLLMKQVNLQKNDFRDENLIVLCRTCESKLVKDNTRELITEYLNQVP